MKKIIMLSISILIFSLLPITVYCLFIENFNDGKADNWKEVSGEWKVENGEYIQSAATDKGGGEARNRASGYAIGDKSWIDYIFSVKINPISSNNYA